MLTHVALKHRIKGGSVSTRLRGNCRWRAARPSDPAIALQLAAAAKKKLGSITLDNLAAGAI